MKIQTSLPLLAFGLVMLALAGCQAELETQYGQREGLGAKSSVNGTAALSEMFEQKGHKVLSWNSLSPKLRTRADVIVWFPNDFKPPSTEVRRWLETWLDDKPDRTLIYVGRDFDAASWYWDAILPSVPPSQTGECQSRKSAAQNDFSIRRAGLPKSEDCDWFTINSQASARQVRTLQGDPQWLQGVDPSKLSIELRSRITPPEGAEVLLQSEKDVLVSRQYWEEGHLIVVANGSFLLNAMLVNHEHRKLAHRLIDEVGPPAKTVVFLESYPGGPPIRNKDISPRTPTGMEIFHAWPTNWILLHLAIVGILFCFARFPIFRRPRELQPESRSDFGKHIQALGEMLQRSGDTAYAYARLLHYRQTNSEVGIRKSETASSSSPAVSTPASPDPQLPNSEFRTPNSSPDP